jgi:hypothetical protein
LLAAAQSWLKAEVCLDSNNSPLQIPPPTSLFPGNNHSTTLSMAKQGHRFQLTCDPLEPELAQLQPSRRQRLESSQKSVDNWIDSVNSVNPNSVNAAAHHTTSTSATVATSTAHPQNPKSVDSGDSNAATKGSKDTITTNSSRNVSAMKEKDASEQSVIETAVETVKEKIKSLIPATATTGFFQQTPRLGNQYDEDAGLQRVLQR